MTIAFSHRNKEVIDSVVRSCNLCELAMSFVSLVNVFGRYEVVMCCRALMPSIIGHGLCSIFLKRQILFLLFFLLFLF